MTPKVATRGAVMDWARMLAYVTGTVDQELLARNEYLTAENRILKAQLNGRLKLSDAERSALGEIGHRLGRTALAEVATFAKPDTILAWYRNLVAHKFDGSKARRGPGRPRVMRKVEQLLFRLAEENRCPCLKLKLEHIDGVARPRSATNACSLFGTHHAEPARPSAAIGAF
jgi:hypothetical protein